LTVPSVYPLNTRPPPKGTAARVLLTSVFGPYAQDDEFGSRTINPMELYHNQVTKAQGAFSIRRFHRSWGILMIQENISAPCSVLDFPSRKDFARELRTQHYDVVGISSIIVNVGKVREMCRMVREISPHSTIIVGGHVSAIPGISAIIDADHIVKGDGISWMREYLGEDPKAPVTHPPLDSGFDLRIMGLRLPNSINASATIVASMGCPLGCNFCTTSAFFGGKGKMLNLYPTGAELFGIMEQAERTRGVKSFFILDENFLLQKPRALELLALMVAGQKSWTLHIFSSANAIAKYRPEQLVELGIASIWIGLESPKSQYAKLAGSDTMRMTAELRDHGIVLLGSTIVGLEHHTPENIKAEIEYAVEHDTDLHQFMLYTPVPGTPLYKDMSDQGRLLDVDLADIHGQDAFNFRHPAISREESRKFLGWAFQRDFERNGPSLFRICRTTFAGWKRHKDDPNLRVRARIRREAKVLKHAYAASLWAIEHRLRRTNREVAERVRTLRKDLEREFGIVTRLASHALGPVLSFTSWLEERRTAKGKTYDPGVIVNRKNWGEA
jgi:radical SAM superfamily enzyme YgiQ (UPF0313 family)